MKRFVAFVLSVFVVGMAAFAAGIQSAEFRGPATPAAESSDEGHSPHYDTALDDEEDAPGHAISVRLASRDDGHSAPISAGL